MFIYGSGIHMWLSTIAGFDNLATANIASREEFDYVDCYYEKKRKMFFIKAMMCIYARKSERISVHHYSSISIRKYQNKSKVNILQ